MNEAADRAEQRGRRACGRAGSLDATPAAPATMRWPSVVPSGHGTDADAGEYLNESE
jgi:hypothetical protein